MQFVAGTLAGIALVTVVAGFLYAIGPIVTTVMFGGMNGGRLGSPHPRPPGLRGEASQQHLCSNGSHCPLSDGGLPPRWEWESVSVDSPSQPFGRGDQHAVGTAAATRTQARAMQSLPGSIIHKYGAVNDS
ncbi:hypothetical protein Pd630_LPD10112 (plasmid) [Rhodococcus opacus PD630]|nr:hypothetical protein Pd630_LPD10112 [Rhodococcus opacus PD630]